MKTPRFAEVPDDWKHPFGPYRQAPDELGGEWWLVNPFTGEQPWMREGPIVRRQLPEGFVEIFGERPRSEQFRQTSNPSLNFRIARDLWEQDLRYFKRAGLPEWMEPVQLGDAQGVFRHWGMGEAKFYEGRYDWMARFPDSLVSDFEVSAWGAVNATHLNVAKYQIRLLNQGIVPSQRHPFVPHHLWPEEEDEETSKGEVEVS